MEERQVGARQVRVLLAARMVQVELAPPVARVGKVALPDLFLHAMRIRAMAVTQASKK
jgi:hypothetical protein